MDETKIDDLEQHVRLIDFEYSASKLLAASSWDYLQTGAGAGSSAQRNRDLWEGIKLIPHVLRGVSNPSTQVKILGRTWSHPICLAPVASHGAFHPGAEIESQLGAASANATLIVSTHGSLSIKEFSIGIEQPWWFQLYIHRDRAMSEKLILEAQTCGAEAIILTIDTPVAGYRDQDRKSFVGTSQRLTPGQPDSSYPNLVGLKGFEDNLPRHRKVLDPVLDPEVTWKDIEWVLSVSKIPVIVKGVLRPEDATRLLSLGVSGLVVSNHGGRNLDGGISALVQLPFIRRAVGENALLLVDGGITRGSDIVKALSLGANAIMIGRPYIWGLSCFGAAGVQRVIEILQSELETTMILCGMSSIGEIDSDLTWTG